MDKDALYAAAIAGDADAIAKLEMEADRVQNEYGDTILHVESENGNTERVRFILREFAHKNLLAKLDKFKQTALHLALYEGHTEVGEILIDAARHLPVTSFQAFLRQAGENMNTALHAAVMFGHASIVKLLVEADPSDTHIQNDDGETPLYIAVEQGYNDIVEIISTTCTAPSLDGPDGSAVVRVKNLDQAKSPGGTLYKIMDKDALYAAAIAGDADAIAGLEMQADKLYEDEQTILHIESREGNTEHVRFILAKLTKSKHTALHFAFNEGRTEVGEILIDAARHLPVTSFQAFLRQGDQYMDTALHIAVLEGHASIVKLLVEADPSDRHIQNDEGKTPMYIAVKKGYKEIVKLICTTCTAPSLDGPRGRTALHAAIKHPDHDIEVVSLLIGAARHLPPPSDNDNPVTPFQAFLRQYDEELNTALHIAVLNGKVDIVKLLVEADPSDTHIQNKEGKTPIYIAAERGYIDIVKVICTTCTEIYSNLDGPGGSTALHAAIKNLDKARKEDRADVIRLIIEAAKRANNHLDEYEKVRRLVELFNRTDGNRCMILELAVEGNYLDVVEFILAENPDLIGIMPLIHKARDKEYNDMVNLLTQTYQYQRPNFELDVDMSKLISATGSRQEDDFEYAASYEDVGHAMITASQPSGFQPMKSLPQPVNMNTMVLENEGDTSAQLPCISQPCEDMRKSTPSINTPDNVLEGIHLDELQKAQPTISKESLSQHFGKSLDEAREIFGDLSRTKFKKMCRGVGIKRWEYGKRKMGSNSSSKHKRRINNEEPGGIYSTDMPCVHDPPVISHTSQVLSTMDIKAKHNDLIIRFELPELSGKSELEDNVIKRLHLDRNSFSIKYEDDGGQWVLITCDEDVRYCMKMSRSWKKTPINMWVDTTANQ